MYYLIKKDFSKDPDFETNIITFDIIFVELNSEDLEQINCSVIKVLSIEDTLESFKKYGLINFKFGLTLKDVMKSEICEVLFESAEPITLDLIMKKKPELLI